MKTFSAIAAAAAIAVLAGFSGLASAQAPTGTTNGMLTDSSGMTLYTFDKDSAGKSACNGPCARNWPPLLAAEGDHADGGYSLVTRDDGKRQWAYKGKPLYTWSKDHKPGDKTGDGFKNAWHIVQP